MRDKAASSDARRSDRTDICAADADRDAFIDELKTKDEKIAELDRQLVEMTKCACAANKQLSQLQGHNHRLECYTTKVETEVPKLLTQLDDQAVADRVLDLLKKRPLSS